MNTKFKNVAVAFSLLSVLPVLSLADNATSSNNDGSSIAGQFASGAVTIPNFSDTQIQAQVAALKQTMPDANIKYQDLFDARDQLAFNELQVLLTTRISNAANDLYKMKKLFVEGSVVFDHFAKDADADTKTGKQQLGSVAETYRSVMKEDYNGALGNLNAAQKLDPNSSGSFSYAYKIGNDGKITSLVQVTVNSPYSFQEQTSTYTPNQIIIGSDDGISSCDVSTSRRSDDDSAEKPQHVVPCQWEFMDGGKTIEDVANDCTTAVCVQEVGKVAQEMLATSISLYQKVKFENSDVNHVALFMDPKHSMLRLALSNYIEQLTANRSVNAPLVAILGLTDLAYIPTLSLVDAIINLRQLRTTFDFTPDFWNDGSTRKHAAQGLSDDFTKIGAEKLRAAANGNT